MKFELISGERRFRASQIAGLEEIPAYVRLADDRNMLELAIVENLQREDLDPIEMAYSCKRMMDELGLTQEEVAKRLGKGRSTVTNFLRLLKLPAIIQAELRDINRNESLDENSDGIVLFPSEQGLIDKPRINNDSMIVINFIGTKIKKFQCNGVAKSFLNSVLGFVFS